jgi:glycosyltransferase 2 family protein
MSVRPRALPRSVRAGAKIAVGVGILLALALTLGGAPFLRGLSAISVPTIAIAVTLSAIATAAAAWRWRALAQRLGVPLTWPAAIGAYYRSQFLNSVLPGGVVGDVDRAISHGRRAGSIAAASRAVVAERSAGQLVQTVAAVVVVIVLGVRLDAPPWGALVVGLAFAATLAVVLLVSGRARRAMRHEGLVLAQALADAGTLVRTTVASLVVVACHCATFAVAAVAVGAAVDPPRLAAVALVTVLAGSLPLSVGGWGTREAVAAWVFAATGLGAGTGVAASTAFGVLATIAVLPGLGVLIAAAVRDHRQRRPLPSPLVPRETA